MSNSAGVQDWIGQRVQRKSMRSRLIESEAPAESLFALIMSIRSTTLTTDVARGLLLSAVNRDVAIGKGVQIMSID